MTPFWISNISILYESKYIFEILPYKTFDLNRKLNSLLRLSIYYSIIMYILTKNDRYFYIPFIVSVFTYIIYQKNNKFLGNNDFIISNMNQNQLSKQLDGECKIPTKNNPFMNPLIGDKDNTEPCQSYKNKGIQKMIEDNFNEELYRDPNDLFGKNNSQRQFMTIPGKTVVNDRDSFQNWLYKAPPTCKEGNTLECGVNGRSPSGGAGSPSGGGSSN